MIAFLAALSGLSAVAIDVMLPAMGEMREAFGLEPDSTRISFVVTTYLLGLGAGQVLYGPLADRFGRRPALFLGLSLYVVAAAAVVFSPSLTLVFVARFVMGVGAASPRAMSMAIARDRWEGDAMARVMTLVMVFFLLSPAIAPLLGEALLVTGRWEAIFVFAGVFGGGVALWTARFEETLDPADRLPLTFARTARSARIVFGSRWALGYALVLLFDMSAFFVYLSSSELLFDDVFDRGSQFAVFFALGALVMAGANVGASRLIPRVGAVPMIRVVGFAYVVLAGAFFAVTVAASGRPSFWVWVVLLIALNALHSTIMPTANALAMQPLGKLAGTGSGVIGTLTMVGGSIAASFVNRTIDGSATPMALAYVVFGVLVVVAMRWARGGSPAPLASG